MAALKLKLLSACSASLVLFAIVLAVPTISAQSEEQVDDAQTNNTLDCWSCIGRYRTWTDCQNLNEREPCDVDPATGEVSCMLSQIQIVRPDGALRYHRLSGCALNETGLQTAFLNLFDVTFEDDNNVTLNRFEVCKGELCNVMDAEALKVGSRRVVQLNVIDVNGAFGRGPLVGLLVLAVALTRCW
ncbi:uncharacterized protein LOC129754679 [Uranotaenia lowii]|uniref:uncharacterized protein LOC129754679 n=1 Tax=Uranotaenia lowii TaxID=190385 RepID=UPI00247A4146|nr:uncharacterized protein LOC129754679 [Uranotaenia lowii]